MSPALAQFDTWQLVALAAAVGWASGLRLYAVLFILGGAGYLGVVDLPAGLKLQAGGRIGGYVEFIGTPNSGQAKQRIAIDVIERNVSWLAANKYSQRKVYYGAGGQRFSVEAVEDTTDAQIQLQSDPGYDIGRLRNETENQRLINVTIDGAGNQVVEAPLARSREAA